MIPYDSFLIDPFLLFLSAWALTLFAGRLYPAARIRFIALSGCATLAVFWITSLSLYFNLEWTRWIWEMCGAENGRDWMINSGVFHFEFRDTGPITHLLSALCFVTYPAWFWFGAGVAWRVHGMSSAKPLSMRLRGQSGRVETWYATFSDPVTGRGYWLHGEVFAPAKKRSCTRVSGWCAVFDPSGPPRWERYGPEPLKTDSDARLASPSAVFDEGTFRGRAGRFSWDLKWADGTPPLDTFPRWLWETEALPGAQIVAAPTMTVWGLFKDGDRTFPINGAKGAFGHIFARGHARRWAWLHADLDDGDCLEIVAAQSAHAPFCRLGLLGFVALRRKGAVWPGCRLLAALKGFEVGILDSGWTLSGTYRGRRLSVAVDIPKERSLTLEYPDPDGSSRFCTNSEVASARILLESNGSGGWRTEEEWVLQGTAHTEIGESRAPAACRKSGS